MPQDPMIVEAHPPSAMADGRVRLACTVRQTPAKAQQIWLHVPADAAPATDDWMAPLLVLPAMQACRPLRLIGRISPALLANMPPIQRIYEGFDAAARPVEVTADEIIAAQPPAPPRSASFFSGGLDSWYTALSNVDTLDDVAFGIGIDMRPDDQARIDLVLPRIAEAAAALGKPLIVFETNLRELYYGSRRWAVSHMGAGLAACALGMSGRYSRFLIPASFTEQLQHLHWGTNARLDPLWSTEAMSIIHDGTVSRVAKTRLLAGHEGAMRTLRVCWRKEMLAYNCGRCSKCVRMLVALRLAGAQERCRTFDRPLDLREVAHMRYDVWGSVALRLDLLAEAIKDGQDMELVQALAENVARRPRPGARDNPAQNHPAPNDPAHDHRTHAPHGSTAPDDVSTTAGAAAAAPDARHAPPRRRSIAAKVRREIARVLRHAADRIHRG